MRKCGECAVVVGHDRDPLSINVLLLSDEFTRVAGSDAM